MQVNFKRAVIEFTFYCENCAAYTEDYIVGEIMGIIRSAQMFGRGKMSFCRFMPTSVEEDTKRIRADLTKEEFKVVVKMVDKLFPTCCYYRVVDFLE